MTSTNKLETVVQHAGEEHRVGKGLVSAIEVAVTFEPEEEGGLPIYARLSNTKNHREVSKLIASIEGAESAAVFASGMAAMTSLCFTVLRPGDHILCQANSYGGNHGFITKTLRHWGVESTFLPIDDWESGFRANTRLAYFESISNPFCIPQNVSRAVALARSHNVPTVCDNTFASPYNLRPLELGVDYVLESGTKYLNGHSDVICGVLASSASNISLINDTAMYLGGFLSAQSIAGLMRGLRTFVVRMERHNQNGAAFASAMRKASFVKEVFYGTTDEAISRLFPRGYSGMVTVRFNDDVDVLELMRKLRMIRDVPSLAGTETTACMPFHTTNRWMSLAEKSALGIDEKLVRFSIGLEDVADVCADIESAV